MRRRGLGVLLILTFLVASGTLVQDYRFDTALARERADALAIDRELAALDVALVSFAGAQTGYVAVGQDPAFWMTHATELSAQIESALGRLRQTSTNTDAHTRYDAARTALGDVNTIDARARDLVKKDQRFGASDVIFIDAVDASQQLASELATARTVERSASDQRLTRITRLRLGMNAVALGFLLVVAMFFRRLAGQDVPAPSRPADEPATAPAGLLDLRPDTAQAATPAAAPVARPAAAASASPPPAARPVTVNLVDAAELCVDLARVMDGRDVPALVERAARALEAKGLVVWIADPSGALLRPTLAHGYPEKVLARLGTLQMDADNVTSLAFRSLRTQTVPGATPGSPGAIAVPLITPSGCIGVMAAEVRYTTPDKDIVSLARMIAAQFATIVPSATDGKHDAADSTGSAASR